MNKFIYKKTVVLFAILIWMGIIFCFSAQPATESQAMSDGFINKLLNIFISDFEKFDLSEKTAVVESLSFYIRKIAHAMIYFVLSCLIRLYFHYVDCKVWQKNLFTVLLCFLYAVFDEIHQYFVPGRSCELRDVLIDSAGAIVGILFLLLIAKIFNGRRDFNV